MLTDVQTPFLGTPLLPLKRLPSFRLAVLSDVALRSATTPDVERVVDWKDCKLPREAFKLVNWIAQRTPAVKLCVWGRRHSRRHDHCMDTSCVDDACLIVRMTHTLLDSYICERVQHSNHYAHVQHYVATAMIPMRFRHCVLEPLIIISVWLRYIILLVTTLCPATSFEILLKLSLEVTWPHLTSIVAPDLHACLFVCKRHDLGFTSLSFSCGKELL